MNYPKQIESMWGLITILRQPEVEVWYSMNGYTSNISAIAENKEGDKFLVTWKNNKNIDWNKFNVGKI